MCLRCFPGFKLEQSENNDAVFRQVWGGGGVELEKRKSSACSDGGRVFHLKVVLSNSLQIMNSKQKGKPSLSCTSITLVPVAYNWQHFCQC